MATTPPRSPRREPPRARTLREAIDTVRASEISAADVEHAKGAWRRDAPAWAKSLLNATTPKPAKAKQAKKAKRRRRTR